MVVAEILTGIALVQKSVEFIKSNIATAKDIKDIAKQIDGFFEGEEQMNKKQGKGMGIAQQFGIESTASDFIDRKLLEEQRYELKLLIDNRFGHGTWNQILSERADKIKQAKEAQRQAKLEAKKQREEIFEALKWVALTLLGIGVVVLVLVMGLKAFAYELVYEYKPRDYSRQQKEWRNPDPKKYTTCRLKKRITSKYTNKKACIYEGGNKTFTMMIETWCPKKYKCVYDPNGTEPDIDKVMDSLRSIKD
jgi:hypothetical protein